MSRESAFSGESFTLEPAAARRRKFKLACPDCQSVVVHHHLPAAGGWVWYCLDCHPRPPLPHGEGTLFTIVWRQEDTAHRHVNLTWEEVQASCRKIAQQHGALERVIVEQVSQRGWREGIARWGTSE